MVVCENGHSCCKKHHVERIRAIYQEGRMAYEEGGAQCCFVCRVSINDDDFGDDNSPFFKCLRIMQTLELTKSYLRMQGIDPETPENKVKLNRFLHDLHESRDAFKQFLGDGDEPMEGGLMKSLIISCQ